MIFDDLDTIAANSFRNFHAKGLDYLCLHRSRELTIKAYFYEHAGAEVADVVCPHDHRYPFSTHVLAGESGHTRYLEMPVAGSPTHQRFSWRTPLLGGDGFTKAALARLEPEPYEEYRAGESYWCRPDEVHTIRINAGGTVLLLYQHADTVPIGQPTSTYVQMGSPEPTLTRLYDRMPLELAEQRMGIVCELLAARNQEPFHV